MQTTNQNISNNNKIILAGWEQGTDMEVPQKQITGGQAHCKVSLRSPGCYGAVRAPALLTESHATAAEARCKSQLTSTSSSWPREISAVLELLASDRLSKPAVQLVSGVSQRRQSFGHCCLLTARHGSLTITSPSYACYLAVPEALEATPEVLEAIPEVLELSAACSAGDNGTCKRGAAPDPSS